VTVRKKDKKARNLIEKIFSEQSILQGLIQIIEGLANLAVETLKKSTQK